MEVNNRKKELVKLLLNKEMDTCDENELIEILLDNPIAIDTDKNEDEKRTFGDKLADKVTKLAGSWGFIIGFCTFLILWMVLNTIVFSGVDDYPFILLNLILSCIAAIQAPIIMMSQNREAKKESLKSTNDYKTNIKSELILEELHDKMDLILKKQNEILDKINNEKN